jgi:predicted aminopeptidase
MATNNPKISAYVPTAVYERLIAFQKTQKLSASKTLSLILVEYFGLQEVVQWSTAGIAIGGVSLSEIEKEKKRQHEFNNLLLTEINDLRDRLEALENKPVSKPRSRRQKTVQLEASLFE